jgi:hypothetical protein
MRAGAGNRLFKRYCGCHRRRNGLFSGPKISLAGHKRDTQRSGRMRWQPVGKSGREDAPGHAPVDRPTEDSEPVQEMEVLRCHIR